MHDVLMKVVDLKPGTFLLKIDFFMHGIFQTNFSVETFGAGATF